MCETNVFGISIKVPNLLENYSMASIKSVFEMVTTILDITGNEKKSYDYNAYGKEETQWGMI